MFRTSRTVSRMRGPRSTRSPRKTAWRPSGWAKVRSPQGGSSRSQAGLTYPSSLEQLLQLVAAAVDIADDVERAVLVPLVVPERHSLDDRRLDLLGRLQHEDVPEPLPLEPPSDRRSCDFWLRTTCGPKSRSARPAVALLTDPLGQVEHDRHRQAVVLPGQFHQRLAGLGLDVGGVNHREPPQGQPLPGDEPEHLEGVVRDRLVVLVVARPSPGRRRTREPPWAGSACGRTCSCPSRWGRSGRRG